MDNNKLSNDINEKISTVFQLYAVNPIKDDIDDNFDKFEKNFFSEDAPFAVLQENINDIKNKKIPNIGSKIDELKDSIDLCEQSVNFSVNNAAEQFAETAEKNQKAIISRIEAASEDAFEKMRSENDLLKKSVCALKNDIGAGFNEFEKKNFSEESPFAGLLKDIDDIKRNIIPNTDSKIDALQESVNSAEKSVNQSVNNAAEQFAEMAGNNQKTIISRIDAASEETFERLCSENAFLRKIIYVLMAISGTSLAGTVALLVLNFLG
ncbi:MAG: hypothetical protein IJD78_06345 [Clostridia bacterium]|nr:hypothetical protein [Clostridia bacterium]